MLHQSSISLILNKIYFITNTAYIYNKKIYFTPLFMSHSPVIPSAFSRIREKISPIYPKQIPLCYL